MHHTSRLARSTLTMLFALMSVAALWGLQPAHAEDGDGLSVTELRLLETGGPVNVLLDAETGEIISVTEGTSVQPLGAVRNGCTSARACWYGYASPLVPYGFDGTGASGSWPERGTFLTKKFTARVCWLPVASPNQLCTASFGPNSSIGFNAAVNGTRVYLS